MPRATIQLYDRPDDARRAVEDLHAVGLGDVNVGSLIMGANGSSGVDEEAAPGDDSPRLGRVLIPDLGPALITGWLADPFPSAPGSDLRAWLSQLLEAAQPSAEKVELIINTLREGGGIVSVRPDDRAGSPPTVEEILEGRNS